jgi:quercetin dioxygenase-like cupin family protein
MMIFKNKGDIELGHKHQFDHATLLASGSVLVKAKGKETEFKAPTLIWISKDIEHELVALEDNTVCACIHALLDSAGDIVDPSIIPEGALPNYVPPGGLMFPAIPRVNQPE